MNTNAADGTMAGGGEILQYWGNAELYEDKFSKMDTGIMKQFMYLPIVRYLIIAIILFLMIVVILRIFNVKSPFKGKGITRELDYAEKIRKHDLSIIRANRAMAWVTEFIDRTPFVLNSVNEDYWQYNLTRANVRIPGGERIIKAKEFNALVMFAAGCIAAVSIIILLFANSVLGWILLITTVIVASTVPMMVIRTSIKTKDNEIKANFADYYLMLHYVLIANAKTPLSSVMKSYAKTTNSKEMIRYIDSCVHYIDTYNEYEAARYISREYREIPEVVKLMRLIRQANEGGDIAPELRGFRTELLKEREYVITKRMEKIVARARASFNLLMPILFQAILSAMSIYLTDLGMAGSMFGM